MKSIEEESTFFVTIEKNNIKSQIHNFKNMKSKYFCRPIKTIKNKNIKNHKSSFSLPDNLENEKKKLNSSLPTSMKKINNISKINMMQNYIIPQENKTQNYILNNNNKYNNNQNKNNNNKSIEENIDIDDDIDEFCDVKCNISINKPKLPFYNNNYYNNMCSSSISRNVLNNYLNKTSNSNSKIVKNKNDYNKGKFYKNKSCSFIHNDLSRLKINQSISIIDSKIGMLNNLIRRRNLQILSLQLFFEKNNSFHKIRKKNKIFEKTEDEVRKQIYYLKIKKAKCEEIFIKRKQIEKEINKEKLLFSNKKAELIEKILDYKILIFEKTKNKNYNSNNNNIHNDESTIINDSNIFDNEYNILDTKENINAFDEKNNILKNANNAIINKKEDEKLNNINNNEINCIKNKNAANYFVSKFLVETKAYNKNKNINKYNPNSKFNIFINCSGK